MPDLGWETAPATAPLPAGFPSLDTSPTVAGTPYYMKALRIFEKQIQEWKIMLAAGRHEVLPGLKKRILDSYAIRCEAATENWPVLSDEDLMLLRLPDDADGAYQA